MPIEGPPLFTAYLRDVTERKQAAEEVLASRARIVEAGRSGAQRIERNLHDGAQQRLVAISVLLRQSSGPTCRTAARPRRRHPDRGIRCDQRAPRAGAGNSSGGPDRDGLAAAVRGLAGRTPFAVATAIPEERLPPAIETAFYYAAAEGLTNAAKYAQAANVSVTAVLDVSTATLTVTDDGVGADDTARHRPAGASATGSRRSAARCASRVERRPARA